MNMQKSTQEMSDWVHRLICRAEWSAGKTINDICGEEGCVLNSSEIDDVKDAMQIIRDAVTTKAMLAMHFGHTAKEAMPTMLPTQHNLKEGHKPVNDPIPHSSDDVIHGNGN